MSSSDLSPYGHPKGEMVGGVWTLNRGPILTKAALAALPADLLDDGDSRIVTADGSRWRYDASSTLVDTTQNLVIAATNGAGKWVRADVDFDIKLPIGFATADATALFTVPVGFKLLLEQIFWDITTAFTGGASAAIGLSSDAAPYTTKGMLLGGASGDVLATLVAGITQGTIGTGFSAAPKMVVIPAGNVVRLDQITSAFTAGAGFVHLVGRRIG